MDNNNFFYVIPQLRLKDGSIKCRPNGKRALREVFFKQGDLDGACGVYSFLMALAIMGTFEPGKVLTPTMDLLTNKEKAFIRELNKHGLYRKGLSGKALKSILETSFNSSLKVVYRQNEDISVSMQDIIDHLDEGVPVILGLTNSKRDFYHWVLAVGYQNDDLGEVSSLMTLDPAASEPWLGYWNGILNLSSDGNALSYLTDYTEGGEMPVELEDSLYITRKPIKR